MSRRIADVLAGNLPKRPPRVNFYVRVSTDKQWNSPRAQRDALTHWHQVTEGLPTDAQFFEDVESAGRLTLPLRSAGARMMLDLQAGDVIAATRGDRLFRRNAESAQFLDVLKAKGVTLYLIHTQGKVDPVDPGSSFVYNIGSAVAEYERHTIAERTRVVLQNKRKRKLAVNRWGCCYGFKVVDGVAVSDPYEKAVWELIWALHTKLHLGSRQIRDVLNYHGLLKRGRLWKHWGLAQLLKAERERLGISKPHHRKRYTMQQLEAVTREMFQRHASAESLASSEPELSPVG